MDKEALFWEAFQSGKDAIYRICCCYLRDPEDRKDAYQEALLRVYQHIGSFQGKSSLTTWLYRIAVNTCLDFLRRRKRREKVLDRNHEPGFENVGDPTDHGNEMNGAIDAEKMYACIQSLPVVERTLVSLYLEDASTKEMAAVMGISEANVRVKLTRIRETLRCMLEVKAYESR